MSSRVTTVALCLVSRTALRHDGHVKMVSDGDGKVGDLAALAAWKLNHSLRQAPQKVCRQSRRVSGW